MWENLKPAQSCACVCLSVSLSVWLANKQVPLKSESKTKKTPELLKTCSPSPYIPKLNNCHAGAKKSIWDRSTTVESLSLVETVQALLQAQAEEPVCFTDWCIGYPLMHWAEEHFVPGGWGRGEPPAHAWEGVSGYQSLLAGMPFHSLFWQCFAPLAPYVSLDHVWLPDALAN